MIASADFVELTCKPAHVDDKLVNFDLHLVWQSDQSSLLSYSSGNGHSSAARFGPADRAALSLCDEGHDQPILRCAVVTDITQERGNCDPVCSCPASCHCPLGEGQRHSTRHGAQRGEKSCCFVVVLNERGLILTLQNPLQLLRRDSQFPRHSPEHLRRRSLPAAHECQHLFLAPAVPLCHLRQACGRSLSVATGKVAH